MPQGERQEGRGAAPQGQRCPTGVLQVLLLLQEEQRRRGGAAAAAAARDCRLAHHLRLQPPIAASYALMVAAPR